MAWFKFILVGCQEEMLLEVEADTLGELGRALSVRRFLEARMVSVDGEPASCAVLVPVPRIRLVVEPG